MGGPTVRAKARSNHGPGTLYHEAILPEPRPRAFAARIAGARPLRRPQGLAALTGGRMHDWGRAHLARRLAVLLLAIAVPAMAQNTFGLITPEAPPPPRPLGFEVPGESFPGSAFYYLEDQPQVLDTPPPSLAEAASAPATDGPAPVQSHPGVLDPGPAARALRLVGTMTDRARAQYCLTLAVYYEAATEPDAGQRAVAQVVLNRVAHPAFPNTVCGVVFQGSERSTGCQFTFTCDGSLVRKPARMWWDRAARVASRALAGEVYTPVGLATHYHTLAVHPYWADSLTNVGVIGAHIFYRWRGKAGEQAAFTTRYYGGEPVAAPHPRLASAAAAPAADAGDPLALARVYEASLAQARAASGASGASAAPSPPPTYSPEVAARGGDALYRADRVPASGQVREEYANSGRWLTQPGAPATGR